MAEIPGGGRPIDRERQFKATVVFAFAVMILMLITIMSLFRVEIWEQVAQRSILVAGIIGFLLVLLTVGLEAEGIALTVTFVQITSAALTPILFTGANPQYLLAWLEKSQFSWPIVLAIYAAATAVWIVSVIDLWSLRTKARDVFQQFKDHFR